MSDLLGIGASGVATYRNALGVVGDNIANAQTKGYVRRDLATTQASTVGGTNPLYRDQNLVGGVRTEGIVRGADEFLINANRLTTADANRASTRATWLAQAEEALPDDDTGLGARLTAVFNAADALAADPSSTAPRQQFLQSIDGAANAIRSSAAGLKQVAAGIGAQAEIATATLNTNLSTLEKVNASLLRAAPGSAQSAQLLDQRDDLVDRISGAIGVDVTYGQKGQVTLSVQGASGVALIDRSGAKLVAADVAADGRIAITVGASSTPDAVVPQGGTLGGLVDSAATVAGRRRQLDTIATGFATQLNDWNKAGSTAPNVAGLDLVEAPGGAASFRLVTDDTAAIAAASLDGTVENGNALDFQSLRGATGVEARAAALVTGHAQMVAAATSESEAAGARNDAATAAREDASGVDLDREAADLMRYQQAYAGSAKVIQAARETLQTILALF